MKNDNGTILYEDRPSICSFSSVVGKKEAQGPFRDANLIESFMTAILDRTPLKKRSLRC